MRHPAPPKERPTARPRRGAAWPLAGTLGLVALVALLLGLAKGYLALVVVASILVVHLLFRTVFRAGQTFGLALANLVGIYAYVFLFFVESNFSQVGVSALSIGFVMPLAGFVLGALRRRTAIESVILAGRLREERHFGRTLIWLIPVFAIGALTAAVPNTPADQFVQQVALFASMLAIAAIVFAVSREVAVFLLDTGLLFEEFFRRVASLIVPAFAFLTCYSLLVILFASTYFVMDHFAVRPNFRIEGAARAITFTESLYFSLITLSTVGYGDISPTSNFARMLTGVEIVCGILLLLFGFNEILSFAREHRRPQRRDDE